MEVLDYWLRHHPGKPTWLELMDAKMRLNSGITVNGLQYGYQEIVRI